MNTDLKTQPIRIHRFKKSNEWIEQTQVTLPSSLPSISIALPSQYRIPSSSSASASTRTTPGYHTLKKSRRNCLRTLKTIKYLAHPITGRNRKTLLPLYHTIVRSVLDHGSPTMVLPPSQLSLLDPIQNAAIRVCTGVFRTSPSLNLCAESGYPPLHYRRLNLTTGWKNGCTRGEKQYFVNTYGDCAGCANVLVWALVVNWCPLVLYMFCVMVPRVIIVWEYLTVWRLLAYVAVWLYTYLIWLRASWVPEYVWQCGGYVAVLMVGRHTQVATGLCTSEVHF